jgi:hypothetical protein
LSTSKYDGMGFQFADATKTGSRFSTVNPYFYLDIRLLLHEFERVGVDAGT